jgi:hypothetical protein
MESLDLRSSLTLMQKAAIITSLKWVGQWLNDLEFYEPSNRLVETVKLIGFNLSDPVQSAFEEDENLLGIQLKDLNEYQKIWFITELHLATTEKGEIPPNVARVALMISENMEVSADRYIEIIQFAGNLQNFQ